MSVCSLEKKEEKKVLTLNICTCFLLPDLNIIVNLLRVSALFSLVCV